MARTNDKHCVISLFCWFIRVKEELGSGRVRMAWVSLPVVGMLLVWWWVGFSAVNADYIKYKDANQPVAARVGDLLSRMTLEEKIGQMVQIDRSVANVDTMRTYFIGNVYIYTYIHIYTYQLKFSNL